MDISSGVFLPGACPLLDKVIAHLPSVQYYDFHYIIGPTWTAINVSSHINLKPNDKYILLRFPPPSTEPHPLNSDYVNFEQYVEYITAPPSLKCRASDDDDIGPAAKRRTSCALPAG